MSEAIDDHIDDPTEKVDNPFQGRMPYKINETQWHLQFGTDTPYDPDRNFYIVQDQKTLDCFLYDWVTGRCLGWLRRY